MTIHRLTRADARRIAVRAQLLDSVRPAGLVDVVRHLTLLQIDPTSAIAPSADLVAWSRLGSAYARADLDAALANRTLLELQAMIRPREDLVLYRAEMAEWPGRGTLRSWQEHYRDWVLANDACRRDILDRLARRGRCPRATCRTPARCRGSRPAGPTTATSPGCWTSWCCAGRSPSPDAPAVNGCGTWRRASTPTNP